MQPVLSSAKARWTRTADDAWPRRAAWVERCVMGRPVDVEEAHIATTGRRVLGLLVLATALMTAVDVVLAPRGAPRRSPRRRGAPTIAAPAAAS